MKFTLGILCGVILGVVVATVGSGRAGEALDQYLQQQRFHQEQDRCLDLREREFETRMKADDPCRK